MNKICFSIIIGLLILSCGKKEGELFKNPSSEDTGITFTNSLEESDALNILDYLYFYNGGGVAIGDINNDDLPDIFFSGNRVKNKLYINKGNLTFEDISESAGIQGKSDWNTGSVMADVNGDGLLDIYVCAVVGINGFEGHNELFINNGDSTFTESAAKYGLDFDSYSSSAAFLDYDLDGDLDMYLLNHAVHTQESFGRVDLRFERNYETGDKLMRNDGGTFTEVSEEAGIFGGINGYGLGISVSDFNQDGYPDLYIGNDFHEDDYYYINNGDGTFTESLKTYFGHTSRFSMGSDAADINHDGLPDLLSLDMLPEDEIPLKSSEGDDNIQVQRLRIERFGYHYQFTRNMLYINQPSGNYLETALLSGIAATDWSWSALFADYDQDGEQDVFISNGIPKRPNDLDYVRFVSNEQIQKKLDNTKLVDQEALNLMPSGAVHNAVFKGSKGLKFDNKSKEWIVQDTLISGATAYADLDNDGDLDLVTNNINTEATLYINKTDATSNYLKLKLEFEGKNHFGIGSKVFSYHNGILQFKELFPNRGFQSSSQPIVHFGYGQAQKVDSLKIVWPDKTYQILKGIDVNQNLKVVKNDTKPFEYKRPKTKPLFEEVDSNLGIDFVHKEDNHIDFNREKLIPYRVSDRGPAVALGDLNNDSKTDIFFGSSKFSPSKVYLQADSTFIEEGFAEIQKDSVREDVTAVIDDFDGNGLNDLIIGTGGADFSGKSEPLLNVLFFQKDSLFEASTLPELFDNTSILKANDFDNDGDLDLFVGNYVVTSKFGEIPNSYLLENTENGFVVSKENLFEKAGMVTDAVWSDFDSDGKDDLILVGEWMQPKFFKNTPTGLEEVSVFEEGKILKGLWRKIHPFDIDNDGDIDYLLGNWGANSKFKADSNTPMQMYFSDFDDNGRTETIVTTQKNGKQYPLLGLDELSSQIVSLRKTFVNYKDFAGKPMDALFEKSVLDKATILEVTELKSGYLENTKGKFHFVPFSDELQVSPITAFVSHDFNGDGKEDVLIGGNYFGTTPFHGRFDSFPGALISSKNDIILGDDLGLDLTQKSVRHLHVLTLGESDYLMVTFNNEKPKMYKLRN